MKAIVHARYGSPDQLELKDIAKPAPKDNEVLLRVHAASLNYADWAILTGQPYVGRMAFGLLKPKQQVRGRDVAGTVEAVGSAVDRFRPGDEVYAEVSTGSFAEYACVPQDVLGLKPVNLTFEQAAAVPLAAMTALQGLRDRGRIQPGQQVLINGASGGVGTFAVQLAKAFGAEVTGVCSARNADLVLSIGADHVVDYGKEDFTRRGARYDLIFHVAGRAALPDLRRALTPKGTLVLSSGSGGRWLGPIGTILRAVVSSPFVGQSLRPLMAVRNQKDLATLKELIESGKLTPAIDRTYQLSEVPEAMRYFEEEHARAKVVISV